MAFAWPFSSTVEPLFCFLGGQRAGSDDFAVNVAVIERAGLRDFAVGVVRVSVLDDAHRVAAAVEILFAGADGSLAVGLAVFLDGGGNGIDLLDALPGIDGGGGATALLIRRGAGDDWQRGEHLQDEGFTDECVIFHSVS